MKLLYIGGYDNFLRLEMFKYMQSQNYEVKIASTKRDELLIKKGFKTYIYSCTNNISCLSDLVSIFQLVFLIKKIEPDIIHSFDTKPNYLVGLALFFINKKVIYIRTINGLGRVFSSNNIQNQFMKKTYLFLHKIIKKKVNLNIFQNKSDKKFYEKNKLCNSKNAFLVKGSGISIKLSSKALKNNSRKKLRQKYGWENKIIFLFLARISVKKGIFNFLNAAKTIKKKYSNVKFIVVGPTSEMDPSSIAKSDLEKHSEYINYLGYRSDVFDILSAVDVYVLPSEYKEGIPRTLLEAMAMEKMVVVSDVNGCKEVVEDAKCGIIFKSKNYKRLVESLEKCLDYNLLKMGKRGRKAIIKKYSEEIIYDEINKIYISFSKK